jgi:hypothetical protein
MAARGVAVQHLSEEELDGGNGRQHAGAPGGIASLSAHRHNRVRLEVGCPLCFQSRQHGSDTRYHPSTSCMHVGGTGHFIQEIRGKANIKLNP